MSYLILLRHGESLWNKKNLFTGWVDVPLTQKGVQEALYAGEMLSHIPIDAIYCSTLIRSIMTAMLAMSVRKDNKTPVVQHSEGHLHSWSKIYSEAALADVIPVYCADELNERMYGELQGLNKQETIDAYGEEQVKLWRRSYDIKPPKGESLELTTKRTIPYFEKTILPEIKNGKNVLISAHGNSLRACVKDIEGLSNVDVVSLEIATGEPIIYEWIDDNFVRKVTYE
ncbi:MAG: 2,3-bisphosphoglycerate-dependent phosphoglycerate mutase [Chlamydiales bacterium]|nr:2,3-bisphosphoglycerate-dependent phosphoglycerate mutase [Chlamydiales bacterium]